MRIYVIVLRVKTIILLNDTLDLRQLMSVRTNGKNTTSVYARDALVRVKFTFNLDLRLGAMHRRLPMFSKQ